MKILAAVNNKGGVGKTTISKLLTEYFAKIQKMRVLALDMDHQCNFSNRFLEMEIDSTEDEGKLPPIHPEYEVNDEANIDFRGRSSIADIFFGEPVYPYPTGLTGVDILPANSSRLLLAEAVRRNEVLEKVYDQLTNFLNLEEVRSLYDIVIIDTPPSKGPLTVGVIRAATDILIPSIMEPQPVEGIYGMLQLWKQEQMRRSKDNPLNLIGILPNMFSKKSNLHESFMENLKKNSSIYEFILPTAIGRRIVFAEVDAEGARPPSILDLPDNNQAKQEALLACDLINNRRSK
jgi:chromosome partitioning protein